jgi:3'-5' exoribonuclease
MNRQNEGKQDVAGKFLTHAIEMLVPELRGFLYDVVHEMSHHPGGSTHHHGYRYGLLIHTAEVLKLAGAMARTMKADETVVRVAAIMHDWGKIYDYEIRREMVTKTVEAGPWPLVLVPLDIVTKRPGFQKAAHIIASYDRWQKAKFDFGKGLVDDYSRFHDAVGRCILSHHGQLEWGSVLTPSTPEEWCLHLADMASANAGVIL